MPSRQPLLPRTLSPSQIPRRKVRRKASFVLRSDSDDDIASPHDSIYEAPYHSGGGSDENWNGISFASLLGGASPPPGQTNDENSREGETQPTLKSAQEVEFRYGNGTVLDSIKEQTSYATISTLARSKSVDNMPRFSFLTHRDSFTVTNNPRRHQSFSLDDLALIKSYHDACAIIDGGSTPSLSIHEVYAEPKAPLHAPLQRPPTPPGMPSWTQGQNVTPRSTSGPQPNRFQRFFGLPATRVTHISRGPHLNPNSGIRSVSNPGERRAPRFRPPRSVYGPLNQHPFYSSRVSTAQPQSRQQPAAAEAQNLTSTPRLRRQQTFGQRVRFTPSATARDSEANALRDAIESTSNSALHPIAPITPMQAIPCVPQPAAVIKCPHRKGRQEALKQSANNLHHQNVSTFPPSVLRDFIIDCTPTGSPRRQNSVSPQHAFTDAGTGIFNESSSRPTSASSTARLLTAETPPPRTNRQSTPTCTPTGPSRKSSSAKSTNSKSKDFWCWHCQLNKSSQKMDKWWQESANLLCFICCGFEVDDDMGLQHPRVVRFYDGPSESEMVSPRRVILSPLPTVAVS